MTCYNVGRGATSIFYHYAILKGILKRYSPKMIILEFAILNKDQASYDKMSSLLPYYGNHPEIRPFIILKSPFEKYKLSSKIYPFNSLIFTIIAGNLINKERDDINGYVPLSKIWDEPVRIDSINKKYELDKNKIDCFENFIKDCNNMGIQLFVCVSPFFIKTTYSEYSTIIGQKIAETHNVKFYDFSNDTIFTSNNSLFADDIHLSDSGAIIFTNIVINRILNDK